VLFRGSIRENIAISKPQATEEEILEAAREAGVHDFVSRHPMGYDAPVGERGEGLSGGQRQTIALARAMLLAPNIMICDEPTNAMDMQAEEIFTRQIESQIKGKTFVMITHRPHLLKLVDRLILLDRGKVIADGPRDKVLEALTRGAVQVPKE
jgi:ATP-binding cassette subfamily C protein LapB